MPQYYSDSDSDNEAPEAESVSKPSVLAQQQKLIDYQRQQERQKRREVHQRRQLEKLTKSKETEAEVLGELPEELLAAFEEEPEPAQAQAPNPKELAKGTKITFDEEPTEVRSIKRAAERKVGGFKVRLLKSTPRKVDVGINRGKAKWLNRKSVRRTT